MSRLALNKASLTRQTRQLKQYREFLPSLDLKRRQLIAEQQRARTALRALREEREALPPQVGERLPMLANLDVDLTDLVRVAGVELEEQNLVGIRLPRIVEVRLAYRPYGLLGKPQWVDPLVGLLERGLRLRIELQVAEERLRRLDDAVRVVTQRVNLFDKVLIPRTQDEIKRIRIYLADAERAAVVRSKIAKAKRAAVA